MTESTLNLDPRQRAMLDEMGVKVWWPSAAAAGVAGVAGAADDVALPESAATKSAVAPVPTPRAPMVAPTPTPTPAPALGAPRAAPQAGGATVWLESAQRLYTTDGPADGGWLIVVDMPPEADGRHGQAFAGDAGRLLENMLRALRLDRAGMAVHLARTHRGAAATDGAGQPLDAGFAAAAEALAPRVVLALGPLAAQGLLASSEPLGKLRGRLASAALRPGTPLVASYHPLYLLRNPSDKAKAWADLCLAAAQFDAPAS
ncbi:MAG: uracil-DNA glycosylase [Comamonadaceae bacterium]|nr:MAG: uracil-DNA glycosylase [Comamonadaceae bacterium]